MSHIATNNSHEGLSAIMLKTEITDKSNPWHVWSMAECIDPAKVSGKFCVGDSDQMAPPDKVVVE